jgi:putative salt-induced outer membrane protein
MNKILKFLTFFIFFIFTINAFAVDDVKKDKDKKFRLSLEAGATVVNGNSKSQSFYGDVKNNYVFRQGWRNILQGRAENKSENDIRSREYYRVNNQTRYLLGKANYALLELEYIDDRFGGFDYRASETLGFGRDIYKNDEISFSGQGGAGYRQIKLSNGEQTALFTARTALDFTWQLTKTIYFSEHLDISIDREATITRSEANLKAQLNSSLYLKLFYLIENRSAVAQGVKNTDSTTMLIFGYEI